jgi:transcriptional regulator with XRE-family HTH domain
MPGRSDEDNGEVQHTLEIFGEEIATARERHGMTQAQLAARLGRKQPGISDIENGVRNISVRTMIKIARAVGLVVRINTLPRS